MARLLILVALPLLAACEGPFTTGATPLPSATETVVPSNVTVEQSGGAEPL